MAVLLSAAGTPLTALAQDAGDAPPAAAGQPVCPGPAGHGRGGPDGFGAGIGGPAGLSPALGLAAHLAATETYLGLTPAQQDVWRDYSQALIAFLEPGPPPAPQPEGGDPPADQARPLAAESMAQQVLDRADRARTLLAAATALRGTLEPVQIERLQRVDPGFGPARQPPVPRHQPAPAR